MSAQDSSKTTHFGFEEVAWQDKARRVRGVFDSVAPKYDLMNDLMSGGLHRIWKSFALSQTYLRPGQKALDVAGGTGDIARAFQARANEVARRRNSQAETLTFVSDINEAMLVAGIKASDRSMPRLACDAAALPFPDRCADAVTISFGIRNVVEIDTALSEFRRVLRPGGRFACLEFSHMTHRILQEAYDQYSFKVIPWLGERVTGDRASYQYLIESIRRFPPQDDFAARIRAAGFSEVAYRNYSGGIACLHTGWAV